MAATPIVPDVPGRGAWTLKGGLLPLKPGGKNPGYYRLAEKDEVPVGSAFASGKDKSDSAHTVNLAVKAFQRICGMSYLEQDGWLGPKTAAAGVALQKRLAIEADGIFGPATMRAAFQMTIATKADLYAVPRNILTGITAFESEFDLGAVGVNGWDHGLVQINLDPKNGHGANISVEAALDPIFALDWTAKALRTVFNRTYTTKPGISTELAWNVAILNHNSPKNAVFLRDNGTYPTEQSRLYVQAVRNFK
jgi:Transglycosylase SLT domain